MRSSLSLSFPHSIPLYLSSSLPSPQSLSHSLSPIVPLLPLAISFIQSEHYYLQSISSHSHSFSPPSSFFPSYPYRTFSSASSSSTPPTASHHTNDSSSLSSSSSSSTFAPTLSLALPPNLSLPLPSLCNGCGSSFQSTDSTREGYVSKRRIAAHKLEIVTAMREKSALPLATLAPSLVTMAKYSQLSPERREEISNALHSLTQQGMSRQDALLSLLNASDITEKEASLYDSTMQILSVDEAKKRRSLLTVEFLNKTVERREREAAEEVKQIIDTREAMGKKDDEFHRYRDVESDAENNNKNKNTNSITNKIDNEVRLSVLPLLCQRCTKLRHQGGLLDGPSSLIPTPSPVPTLKSLLTNLSAVIILVVDITDFYGTFINNIYDIVGNHNPVLLCCNKRDLLPKEATDKRLIEWSRRESDRVGVQFHSIHIVSAHNGTGVKDMMIKAMRLSGLDMNDKYNKKKYNRKNIYVVGTTNAGKSSLINNLIQKGVIQTEGQFKTAVEIQMTQSEDGGSNGIGVGNGNGDGNANEEEKKAKKKKKKKRSGKDVGGENYVHDNSNDNDIIDVHDPIVPSTLVGPKVTFTSPSSLATSSPIPGTTLGLISFPSLPTRLGFTVFDTPGIVNPHQLSSYMEFDEVKCVLPRKRIIPYTNRLVEGGCLMVGGLAMVEVLELQGEPFWFTVFASGRVSIYLFTKKHFDVENKEKEREWKGKKKRDREGEIEKERKLKPIPSWIGKGNSEEEADERERERETEGEVSENPDNQSAGDADASSSPSPSSILNDRLHSYLIKKIGVYAAPPFTPSRLSALNISHSPHFDFDLRGESLVESFCDIVLPGVGWIAVTGKGTMKIRVRMADAKQYEITKEKMKSNNNSSDPPLSSFPHPTLRSPCLMPFDSRTKVQKFKGHSFRMGPKEIKFLKDKIAAREKVKGEMEQRRQIQLEQREIRRQKREKEKEKGMVGANGKGVNEGKGEEVKGNSDLKEQVDDEDDEDEDDVSDESDLESEWRGDEEEFPVEKEEEDNDGRNKNKIKNPPGQGQVKKVFKGNGVNRKYKKKAKGKGGGIGNFKKSKGNEN